MPNKLTAAEVLKIIGKIEEFVNRSEIIPATAFYRSKVLLGLLSKALTTGRAVCALVDAGFPDEAYGLLRTLVEIFFSVRFISNADSESRASRYAENFGKAHEHAGELIQKFFPDQALRVPEHHEEAMSWAENYSSPHQWFETRGAVGAMAFEDDAFERDGAGMPLKHAFDYEFVYWDSSHFVHATIMSLTAHLSPQGEPFQIRGGPVHPSFRNDHTLFNVVAFLRKSLLSAYRGIREDLPANILEEMLEVMRDHNREPA